MSYEEAIKYLGGQLDLEKDVTTRMFERLSSSQTLYYFYLSIRYPDIGEHEMLAEYFSRQTDSEYTEFLQSIKDFDTWEDVKTFYAI